MVWFTHVSGVISRCDQAIMGHLRWIINFWTPVLVKKREFMLTSYMASFLHTHIYQWFKIVPTHNNSWWGCGHCADFCVETVWSHHTVCLLTSLHALHTNTWLINACTLSLRCYTNLIIAFVNLQAWLFSPRRLLPEVHASSLILLSLKSENTTFGIGEVVEIADWVKWRRQQHDLLVLKMICLYSIFVTNSGIFTSLLSCYISRKAD